MAITSDAGPDRTYALGETIRVTLSFSEAVEISGTPRLRIKMDPAYGEKWAAYERGSGTNRLTFAHTVVEPNLSTQGIAVLGDSLELNSGTIASAAASVASALTHPGLAHDADHRVDWQLEDANRAPEIDTASWNYQVFTSPGNAPRGTLVSKPFHRIFSDPDGDELTYAVAITGGDLRMVDEFVLTLDKDYPPDPRSWRSLGVYDRVFFRAESEADWKRWDPPPADRPLITVTLTATDPGGRSASIEGVFRIPWASYPQVVEAVASSRAIVLTYDLAIDEDSAPAPEQFTVNVVDEDGTTVTAAVRAVSVSGKQIALALGSELRSGQRVSLDYRYDYPDDTPLLRADGAEYGAPSFSGQAVDVSALDEPRPAAEGYPGQLAEVLVELSLRRPPAASAPGDGASAQSSHTTSIVYVIDDSGSMDGDFPELQTALRAVRNESMPNTRVALIASGETATTVFDLTAHSTEATNGPWTEAHINDFIGSRSATDTGAALSSAKALLDADTDSSVSAKKIIFLTDGVLFRPTAVVQSIIDAGIIVDTIGFGSHQIDDFGALRSIAIDTGGVHRTVAKPLQGTTNDPAVTPQSMTQILKSKVADHTATLFLADASASVYHNEPVLVPGLVAADKKALHDAGSGRQVGLALFLGTNVSYVDEATTPYFQKYRVTHEIGSTTMGQSLLGYPYHVLYATGSTDIDFALQQAYTTISAATATHKRVVLITDGISATAVQDSTLLSYKNDSATTLDVVAWGRHADRVQLKAWAESAGGNFDVVKAKPEAVVDASVPQVRDVVILDGERAVTVLWSNPNNPNITKYQYRKYLWSERRVSEWMDLPGTGVDTTSYIFTGVTDTLMQFRIRAVTGDTPGPASRFLQWRNRSFGIGLTAAAGDGQIALSWNNVVARTNSYQYSLRSGSDAWSAWTDIPGSGPSTTSHTISGLTNGVEYIVALRAVTGANRHGPVSAATATPTD